VKILVYCDTFRHVRRFATEFAAEPELDLHYLVAPQPKETRLRYTLRQLVHGAYAVIVDRSFALFRLALAGRLIVCGEPLNAPASVACVRRLGPDIALHSMDIIYRDAIIAASGMGILNAHIGLLPAFRGRSVFEWSLLYGRPTGVTVFFVDAGVDTGARIVSFYPVEPDARETLIQVKTRLFHLAPAMYCRALAHIRARMPFRANDTAQGRRYYVMSRLLLRGAAAALAQRREFHNPEVS
jgi:hypothetical protein